MSQATLIVLARHVAAVPRIREMVCRALTTVYCNGKTGHRKGLPPAPFVRWVSVLTDPKLDRVVRLTGSEVTLLDRVQCAIPNIEPNGLWTPLDTGLVHPTFAPTNSLLQLLTQVTGAVAVTHPYSWVGVWLAEDADVRRAPPLTIRIHGTNDVMFGRIDQNQIVILPVSTLSVMEAAPKRGG